MASASSAKPYQPFARRTVRRQAGGDVAPITIGGCGCCTGRGWASMPAKTNRRAVEARRPLRPQRQDRVEVFVHARRAIREGRADRVELGLQVADTDAEDQSPARDDVDDSPSPWRARPDCAAAGSRSRWRVAAWWCGRRGARARRRDPASVSAPEPETGALADRAARRARRSRPNRSRPPRRRGRRARPSAASHRGRR